MAMSDELGKLGELHQRGVLTDAEFAAAKARVLADATGAAGATSSRAQGQAASAINALRRSASNRWLGGVCGGMETLSGVAAWAWRLSFLLLVLCAGTGVLLYLLMWLLVPEEPGAAGARPTDMRSV